MKKRLWRLLPLLLLVPFLLGIAAPDSGPHILRVDVYRHVLEDDDMLTVVRYNNPYTVPPSETITQAYIGQLKNGAAVLASVLPVAYYNGGYDYGMFSMYLSAADAPAWGGAYKVNLGGNPTLSWTPAIPLVTTGGLNWRDTTSQTATQALMYSHLVAYAEELSSIWSVTLTTETASGSILSTHGETYFSRAIPELRTMCPSLFAAGIAVPEYDDIGWQKTQSEAIKGTWPFDWGGMSEWLGLPSSDEVFRTIIGVVIIFGVCSLLMASTHRVDFTLIAGFGLLVIAAVPGWISPVLAGGVAFASALGAGLVFIAGKAS